MAVQKSKKTRSRIGMRRSHDKLKNSNNFAPSTSATRNSSLYELFINILFILTPLVKEIVNTI